MEKRQKYQRSFMIFKKEDKGYEAGSEPSGYLKIEVRDGKGKIEASFQNLRQLQNNSIYRLYMLSVGEGSIRYASVGTLSTVNGKGEIKWSFDPNNVCGSKSCVDDFNAAVLLVEENESGNQRIVCPLAAYKDKKVGWRDALRRELYIVGEQLGSDSLYEDRSVEKESVQEEPICEESIQKELNEEEIVPEVAIQEEVDREEPVQEDQTQEEHIQEVTMQGEFSEEKVDVQIYNTNANPCEVCMGNPFEIKVDQVERGEYKTELEKLKENLNRFFEKYNPFINKRKDYQWWKVSSPVHLNNIMYQCNIKTPLLFNPAVMMSHFKYRHLIVGIYTDKVKEREYIVCGIPSVYNVDERPFGDLCRWVQLEGSRPRYGAFGYWLVFIEPASGKLLTPG